jgi:hypothetical protein
VEVRLIGGRVVVAAHAGSAMVQSVEAGPWITLHAGHTIGGEAASPASEVSRWLEGPPGVSECAQPEPPVPPSAAAPPAPPTAAVPAALPSEPPAPHSAALPPRVVTPPVPAKDPARPIAAVPSPRVAVSAPAIAPQVPRQEPARLPKEDEPAPLPAGDPAIAEQTQILSAALERLRQAHDPAGALALCDRFAERFPHGVVAPEIGRVRVDALLALGKRKKALEVLERLAIDGLPRGGELRVLRGELRLEAGRTKEALQDFETALPQVSGDVAARARAGRDEAAGKVSGAGGHTAGEPAHEVRP